MKKIYLFIILFLASVSPILAQTPCANGQIIVNNVPIEAVSIDHNDVTGLKLPFWLPAGYSLAAGSRVAYISVIEFNVVTPNTTQQLEFSRTFVVDATPQTVPSGKTWKIESILKYVNPFSTTLAAQNNGPLCVGASLNLTAPTIAGATYSWTGPNNFSSSQQNPSIGNVTAANAGTYSLTVTLNGCSQTATTSVVVNPLPTAAFTFSPSVVNILSNITFTSTQPGTTYAWSFSNGTPATSNAASPVVQWTNSGSVTAALTLTDANNCVGTSQQTINVINCPSGSQTFAFTGNVQQFVVPGCVNQVTIEVWGAEGGIGNGANYSNLQPGKGGYAKGTIAVTPGSTLFVYVGGKGANGNPSANTSALGGWNGGGNGNFQSSHAGGAGGGASDVRIGGTALSNRVIVGGGGGGGGTWMNTFGGNGGHPNGTDGNATTGNGNWGRGGTQSAGGTGSSSGSLGNGGNSSSSCGAGGGGGYYGGGGSSGCNSDGGGGGSSFLSGSLTNTSVTNGTRSGDGQVIITY